MTTVFKNVDYTPEILAFRSSKKIALIRIIHAMADLSHDKPDYFKTNEGKALIHSILQSIHGPNYKLDGKKTEPGLLAELP